MNRNPNVDITELTYCVSILGSTVAHLRVFVHSTQRMETACYFHEDARNSESASIFRSWRTYQSRSGTIESSIATGIFTQVEARISSSKAMEGLANHVIHFLPLVLHRQHSHVLELWISELRQRESLWASLQGWPLLQSDLCLRTYTGVRNLVGQRKYWNQSVFDD